MERGREIERYTERKIIIDRERGRESESELCRLRERGEYKHG